MISFDRSRDTVSTVCKDVVDLGQTMSEGLSKIAKCKIIQSACGCGEDITDEIESHGYGDVVMVAYVTVVMNPSFNCDKSS